jgi:hypothetical protein
MTEKFDWDEAEIQLPIHNFPSTKSIWVLFFFRLLGVTFCLTREIPNSTKWFKLNSVSNQEKKTQSEKEIKIY